MLISPVNYLDGFINFLEVILKFTFFRGAK